MNHTEPAMRTEALLSALGGGRRATGERRADGGRQAAVRTLLPQPALLVRVEEGVHQVVAVVLRDLERLLLDAVVQALQRYRTWIFQRITAK